jgi:hypothetical protein
MPSTTLAWRARMIFRLRQNATSSRSPPVSVCSRPRPRRPVKASASSVMPAAGTSRFSMPSVVPSQLTVQPRAIISRATARPGMTCPPVPAAMTMRWRWLKRGLRA